MTDAADDRQSPYPASPSAGGPPPYPGPAPGAPTQGRAPAPPPGREYVAVPFKDTSGTNAVVGLVMGAIALLLSWIPFVGIVAWLIGGLGMLFSVLGYRQQNASRAMSLVGIVLNGLALLICVIYLLLFVFAIAGTATSGS